MESKRVCATGKAAGGGGEEWKGERVRRAGGVVAMEWQSLYIYTGILLQSRAEAAFLLFLLPGQSLLK